jgi:L-lactate dehydrogenase complex protein LldG
MSSPSREAILSRVRGALQPLSERAAYPSYPDNVASMPLPVAGNDLWANFKTRTQMVAGIALESFAEVAEWLRSKQHFRGYCDPSLLPQIQPAFGPEFSIETSFDRNRVDDYAFGITRAVGAIAETGSVILKDASTSSRLAALAPWVHIAALARTEVFPDVASAVKQLGDDPNVIWCTGPSKTADVEGILIQGVHGPGVQITALL